MKRLIALIVPSLLAAGAALGAEPTTDFTPVMTRGTEERMVIELHQGPCIFKEGEDVPLAYAAQSPDTCERLNRASKDIRQKTLRRLRLRAGKYIFRIYNEGVPWATSFWLRGAQDPALPFVRGEGIKTGFGLDLKVDLAPGVYLYSCPVSHTLDYAILVEK